MHSRLSVWTVPVVVAAGIIVGGQAASAASRIYGIVRVPLVKGQPAAGYLNLYEWDVYVAPDDNSLVGQARRTGTTIFNGSCIDKFPQGGGDYCVDGLSANTYSVYCNQPEFFTGHPKVVPGITLGANENRQVYVELPVEYSTRVTSLSGDPWTWPQSAWYQTYVATGTSVTGMVFRIADSGGGACDVSIHQSNGNPNPTTWPQVGPARRVSNAGSLGDNWVRWRSGQVPTTPGVQYAVKVAGVSRNLQPLLRVKDTLSYQGGRAYDASGNQQNFDLDYMVFGDNDGTIMPVACRNGLKSFLSWDDANWAPGWGQTWVAQGGRLAAVDVWVQGRGCSDAWDMQCAWKVRQGGPTGPQIGPTKTTRPAWWGPGVALHAVSYSPGEVPLTTGQTYFIEFIRTGGACGDPVFNVVVTNDPYSGNAYKWSGSTWTSRPEIDLTMTVVEYARLGPITTLDTTEIVASARKGNSPDGDSFTVKNTGDETLIYTISKNATWLHLSAASGTAAPGETDTINVSYDVSGFDCGEYHATITVGGNAENGPQQIAVTVTVYSLGPDFDCDLDVDQQDFGVIQGCFSGAGIEAAQGCSEADLDHDGDVDQTDFNILQGCMSGPDVPAAIDCED